MSGFKRLVKNSISNIINGFSNVILGIVISPFLVKILSISDFAIWSLVLQIGAFFSLLGFSGQLSVARYITLAKAEKNEPKVQQVINYGSYVSIASIFISLVVLFFIYSNFFVIFDAIKMHESSYAPNVFFIVALSFIIGLIASVYNGYFTGIERNDIPAMVNLISRVVLGVGVLIAANHSMIMMAMTYLVVNILSYVVIFYLYVSSRKLSRVERVGDVDNIQFKEFLSYCVGVLVFNLSTFLIINLNGVLIGRYAFKDYAYYALSLTLVTAVVGFLNAALTPVLQPIVKLAHNNNKDKLDGFVFLLTRVILTLSFTLLIANFLVGKFALNIWIGNDVASLTYPVFVYLLLTNLSRLAGAPLGLVYLARGKQNEIIYLPLLEGVLSVMLTYIFVNTYGIYASAIAMGISTIVIMLIYSFKLIGVAALEKNRIKYQILLAGGPISLLASVYFLAQIKVSISDSSSVLIFNTAMIVLAIISSVLVLKDIKRIKNILES
ncbi:Polysaccharide biosynthesis protein [Cedecea davisae]|uniref:Polysaccharide biosynthesis protein n=1 Tax=Cedecea davisae DSM 4568 TaxID=566551 RepID=S3JS56_9ENTR|nr:oligosaccharide flippase family protein [Cedecea davisae]EPF16014.1 polysaccharide biosynthesis protein [Cedecea davisae DSM 4568]SUX38678.1 Polysaccharide biosynthesis protein [Cedecea davisae]